MMVKSRKGVCIGHEVFEGLSFEDSRSELSYFQYRIPNPQHIFLYLKRKLNLKEKKVIESLHLPEELLCFQHKRGEMVGKRVFEVRNTPTFFSFFSIDSWIKNHLFSWKLNVVWWSSFFRKHGIKVWITPVEQSTTIALQRIALNSLGGTTIHRQRSEYYIKDVAYSYNPADINFSYNKFQSDFLKGNGNHSNEYLINGHSFGVSKAWTLNIDHLLAKLIPDYQNRFIISIFDNIYGPDTPTTKQQMLDFFKFFLDFADTNENVLLLFKSKKGKKDIFNEELKEQIDVLLKKKKVVIFDNLKSLLPACVIKSSHLVIGVNLSTACLDGHLLRVPTLHYYPSYEPYHPIASNFKNIFVFEELNLLMDQVRRVMYKEIILPEIAHLVDPYDDGHGPKRMFEKLEEIVGFSL